MYATIRQYSGTELADLLAARSDDVEALISNVAGLQGYFLLRTDDGCASITVCDDRAGIDQSTRLAADWIRENASGLALSAPDITTGEVIVRVGSAARA